MLSLRLSATPFTCRSVLLVLWIPGFLILAIIHSGCYEVEVVEEASSTSGVLGVTDSSTVMKAARVISSRQGNLLIGEITGDSMEPVLSEGSVVVLQQVPYESLERGMDVVYQNRQGEQVVHKLLQKTHRGWMVKGINNPRADPDLVTEGNLIGVVFATFYSFEEAQVVYPE